MEQIAVKQQHGGHRLGAGRKAGVVNGLPYIKVEPTTDAVRVKKSLKQTIMELRANGVSDGDMNEALLKTFASNEKDASTLHAIDLRGELNQLFSSVESKNRGRTIIKACRDACQELSFSEAEEKLNSALKTQKMIKLDDSLLTTEEQHAVLNLIKGNK